MQELLKVLEDARPDVDFNSEKKLIDGGVLDSFDLALIISDLNDEFDIHIRVTHLNPENFNSAEAMFKLVQELKE
jgi:D-alanine--poly(phosphoribitol) ligase subunit 2